MAVTITHAMQSAKADGPDTDLVQPSDWNANHVVAGAAEVLSANTTKTIGAGGDFATIAEGVAWAKTILPTIGTPTLSLLDGTHVFDQQLGLNRTAVTISAQNAPLSVSITSVQGAPTGSAGNWTYVLNCASVAGISVGEFIVIAVGAGGTDGSKICGCHEITNVDGVNNRITILVWGRSGTATTAAAGMTGYIPKAVIRNTTVANSWLYVNAYSSLTLSNVVLDSQYSAGTSYPVYANNHAQISFSGRVGIRCAATSGIPVVGRQRAYLFHSGSSSLAISNKGTNCIDLAEGTLFTVASPIAMCGGTGAGVYAIGPSCGFTSFTANNLFLNGTTTSLTAAEGAYIKAQGMTSTAGLYNQAVTATLSPTASTTVGFIDIA